MNTCVAVRTIQTIALLLGLLAVPHLELPAQTAGAGRSFVLTVPYISPPTGVAPPLPRLLLTASATTEVALTYTSNGSTTGFSMQAGTSRDEPLDGRLMGLPEQEGKFSLSVRVTATQPVTATLFYDRSFVAEAYAAIPDASLGFEYYAITSSGDSGDSTEVVVMATDDKTQVTITPTNGTRGGRPKGVPFSVSLNRGEVYQIISDQSGLGDLSGTHIVSNKPCGVLSGTMATEFHYAYEPFNASNPLLEQLPAVDAWGREFVVAPLLRQDQGVFKIVAGSCDNTTVTIGTATFSLKRGESLLKRTGGQPAHITSDQPVLVAQFVTNVAQSDADANSAFGDPSMVIVTPVIQWSNQQDFAIPALSARPATPVTGSVPWEYYVQVTLPKAFESQLLIDNTTPTWLQSFDVGTMVVGVVGVSAGFHSVASPVPGSTIVYGYTATDAFGFSPSAVSRPSPIEVPAVVGDTCGDLYDSVLTITNPGQLGYNVSFEFEGDLDGTVLSPPDGTLLAGGGSMQVHFQLKSLLAGKSHGYLVVRGGPCNARLATIDISVATDQLAVVPPFGTTLDFRGLPPTIPFVDSTVYLYNAGSAPLQINFLGISPSDFQILSPTFPLSKPLLPGAFQPVTIRFTPQAPGIRTGTLLFSTGNCPDAQTLFLKGNRQSGAAIGATNPLQVHKLCGPKSPDTLHIKISNLGDRPMTISDATVLGTFAPGEFLLLTPLNGGQLQPGSSVDARVLYTPGPLGVRNASLRIASNAINRDTLYVPFDVRDDSLLVVSLTDTLDFGTSVLCNPAPILRVPLVNAGTIPLGGLYSVVGKPSNFKLTPPIPSEFFIGDTFVLQVELATGFEGVVDDSLQIRIEGCNFVLTIPMRGRRDRPLLGFSADTLDFGLLPYCIGQVDTTLLLRNVGSGVETVNLDNVPVIPAISFTGGSNFPLQLQEGTSGMLRFQFHPTTQGDYLDSFKVVAQSCARPLTLIVRGSYDTARPRLADLIDFSQVLKNSTARKVVQLTNNGRTPYSYAAPLLGGTNPRLRIVRPDTPFVLPPGGSIEIELEYAPTREDDVLDDTLRISALGPCRAELIARVRGEAYGEERGLVLHWQDASAAVGEGVPLRLQIRQAPAEGIPDTVEIHTTLRFDASMILPQGVRSAVPGLNVMQLDDKRQGGSREITMSVRGLLPASGTIAELEGIALLGGADSTPLEAVQTAATRLLSGSAITILDTVDGIFKTLGLCRSGTTRLLEGSGLLRLNPVAPNPVSGEALVEFELVETGRTTLELIGGEGRRVATLFDGGGGPGIYQLTLDGGKLPSGAYWLRLTTPTARLEREFVVVR